MEARSSSVRPPPYSSATFTMASLSSSVFMFSPKRRASFSKMRRPSSMLRAFSSACTKCRILFRARAVTTKLSQSRLGVWVACVTISTMSPFFSRERSGTIFPFTRALTQRWPTSVWMAYAKSTGVAPRGSALTSPFGVKV